MLYLFAGITGVAAVVVFFLMEGKIFAYILIGVAALSLTLQFAQEFNAKSNAVEAKIDATQAYLNLEWAKARGEDKKSSLQTEADLAKANQKSVQSQNDAIRKPLVDALNRQISEAAQDTAPPVSLKK